jgi:hypothetical protein
MQERALRLAHARAMLGGDGQMGLSRTRATNQHGVTLIGNEDARGQIPDQGLVDRCSIKGEVVNICNLRLEQITHNVGRLMLAFDANVHDLIIGEPHAVVDLPRNGSASLNSLTNIKENDDGTNT